jgi:hypothetical protein
MFWPLSCITFSMNSLFTVFSDISIGMDFLAASTGWTHFHPVGSNGAGRSGARPFTGSPASHQPITTRTSPF